MAAALSVTPASGSIDAANTLARIDLTGADQNDASAYDAAVYPTEPAFAYRFRARKSGTDDLFSEVFGVNESGGHSWEVMFPAAGAWTVTLRDTSDDSQVATMAVTVN